MVWVLIFLSIRKCFSVGIQNVSRFFWHHFYENHKNFLRKFANRPDQHRVFARYFINTSIFRVICAGDIFHTYNIHEV